MMAPLCPYPFSGSAPLFRKNTFIHLQSQEEIDETTRTKSSGRAQSEPPMGQICDDRAGSHAGADKEGLAMPISTNMEDRSTDAGNVTPRSASCSTVDSPPSPLPQNASQTIQETAAASVISKPHTFNPHQMFRVEGPSRVVFCIPWTVDAKKVRGRDTTAVSPQFVLLGLVFQMVLDPLVAGGSFQKADGKGILKLKRQAPPCGLSVPMITFWFSVGGSYGAEAVQSSRSLVTHNFALNGLATDFTPWECKGLVDDISQNFTVYLNVLEPMD